ncbi:unnamed protein product [Sphenostylis stenocarpa]|uniref:Uncharacterized protein n=1 Tax=Sphenostylis stenocarpa TaxID=92480 RepID=A0AA86SGB8_9FABA|nr:unnamed protein product [Sphenostylis stenocarpa]
MKEFQRHSRIQGELQTFPHYEGGEEHIFHGMDFDKRSYFEARNIVREFKYDVPEPIPKDGIKGVDGNEDCEGDGEVHMEVSSDGETIIDGMDSEIVMDNVEARWC